MSNRRSPTKRRHPPSSERRNPAWGWLAIIVPVAVFAGLIALNATAGDEPPESLGAAAPAFSLPTTAGTRR